MANAYFSRFRVLLNTKALPYRKKDVIACFVVESVIRVLQPGEAVVVSIVEYNNFQLESKYWKLAHSHYTQFQICFVGWVRVGVDLITVITEHFSY